MVADAEFVLEEQRRAQTAQLPFADDGLAVRQQIGFVHKVRRQQNHLSGLPLLQQVPQVAPRVRIDTGRRFVEENDFRVADQGDADGKFPLLAARQLFGSGVAFVGQVDVFERALHFRLETILGDAADAAEEPQVLARCQLVEEHVVLRTHARHPADLVALVGIT